MSKSHRPSDVSTLHPADIPAGRLWSGVLLAPAAWIAQGSLGWYVGYQACAGLGVPAARMVLGLISVAALGLAIVGWWLAWTSWGRTVPERHPMDIKGWDRLEYMSAGGVLVSSIFTIAIVWAGLSPVLLHGCGGMR